MSDQSHSAREKPSRFGILGQLSTYRNIAYLLLWSVLWAIGGLIIAASFGFAISAGFAAVEWSVVMVLVSVVFAFLVTAVDELLTRYMVDREFPRIHVREDTIMNHFRGSISDTRMWGILALTIPKCICGTLLTALSVTLLFVPGALMMLPLEYNDPRTPPIGDLYLGGVWTISTFGDAVIAAILGLSLLILGIHLLNAIGKTLLRTNQYYLRFSRTIFVGEQ